MKYILNKIKRKLLRSLDNDINYKTMLEIIQNNTNNIIVIDVRTKQEYLEGHLKGAINVPLQDLDKNIQNIIEDKNKIIIVYCQSGGRSKKASVKLEKLGYANVFNLKNGLDGI